MENGVKTGVAVVVVKGDKILMGKRISAKGHANGKWQLPGGKMEWMEDPKDTCYRETLEESGVEIDKDFAIKPMGFQNDCWPEIGIHFVCLFYIANWKSGEPKVTEPDKCSEWRWIDYRELPKKEDSFFDYKKYIRKIHNWVELNSIRGKNVEA